MGQILNKQKQKQVDGSTKNIEIKSKLDVIQDLKNLDQTKNLTDVFPKYEQVYKFLEKKEHRVYGEIYILAETNDPNIQIAVQESFFQNQFEFQMEVENLQEIESFTQQHQNLIQLIKYFDYNYNSMCTSFHRLITVTEYLSRDLSTELFFRKLLIEKTTSSTTPKNGESTTKSNQMQASQSSKSQRSLSANSVAVQNQSQVKNNSNMLHSKRLSEIQRKSVLIVTKVFSSHEDDNIIEDQAEEEENLCEKRGAIAKQIKNRSNLHFNAQDNAYRFQEKEFTYILKSLISGLCYLQMQNRTHQCLRSSSIFIARDGTIKLTDPHLFNQSSLYTYIYKGQPVSGAYLSPMLVSNVEYSVVKPEHNEYKSDVFTLAVIMLEIAYLTKLDNYFDYTEYCLVDVEGLQILAENLKDMYSQSIISLLLQMLDENEDIRPDFVSLAQKLGIFNASTNAVVQLSKNDSQSVIYSKLASSSSSNQKPIPQATSIIIQPSDQSFASQSPRFSKTYESNPQQSIQNVTPKITQISDAKQKQNNFTQILNPYTQDTVRKCKDFQIPEKNSKFLNLANPRSLTPTKEKTPPEAVPIIPIANSSQDVQTISPCSAIKTEKNESICNDLLTPKRPQLAENLDNNYRFMTPLPQVRLQTPDNTTIQKHMHLLNQTPLTKTKQQPFFNKGVSPIKTESTASDIQKTLKTESSIDPQRYQARSTSPIMHHQSSPSKQPITPKSDFNKIVSSQYTPTQVRMSINQSNSQPFPLKTSPFQQQSYSPINSYQTEKSPVNLVNNQNLSPIISNYSTQQQNKSKEAQNLILNTKAQSRKNSIQNQIQSQNGYQHPQNKQPYTVSPINIKQETKPTLSRQSLSAINIQQVGNLNNNRNSISDSSKAFNLVNSSRSPSPITSKSTQQIKKMINQSDEKPSSASIQIQQHIQNKQNGQKNSQPSILQSSNQLTNPNSNNQVALKQLSISNPTSTLPTKQQSQSSIAEKDIISYSKQPTFAPSQIGQQQKPPSLKSSQQQNRQSLQNLNVYTPQSQISNGVNVQAYISSQSTVNRYSYGNIQITNQFDSKSPALTKLSNLSAANNFNGINPTQNESQSQKNYLGIAQKKGSVLKINQNIKSQKHGSLQINEQHTFGQQSIQSSVNNNSQTDSMTDSSQQMKSSSRQSQKSHRYSQSGNQFQHRSKTEIGNEQDIITLDNQKYYDNFFKNDKSPVIQSNLQLLNIKQQQQQQSQQETIYKPYIPKMCINTNNDQLAFDSLNFSNSKQQNGAKIIQGLGDLKPASELFSNSKSKEQKPKLKTSAEESQQRSLKSSASSNLSQGSKNIQIKSSNQPDNNLSNRNSKNELTMSQIDRELEKHRNFQKKLKEEMERQKQQQQLLQQQIVNPQSKTTEEYNNQIPTLEKQKSINTIIDQHIFDNQLRQTPSDIVFPFTNQNYSSTNDIPLKTYNHTGTFGKQPSNDNQNQVLIQNERGEEIQEEVDEKPKNTQPPPKEFGTDYIDQLIAKFKSEITSQIQTSNNQPNKQTEDATETTQEINTNLPKNINSNIPSYTSYYATKTELNNQQQSPKNQYQNTGNINQNDQSNQNNLNIASNKSLIGEKYSDQPSSSERVMKRVESDSIGIGFAGFSSKAQFQLQKKGSLNNLQDEKIASNEFLVVGSRADLPKSPNSYIKQNFTEIHSIPLSQLQKAEALHGLDCQEIKGQLTQQLKAKKRDSINEKKQNDYEKLNFETQQESSVSSNLQEISSVYNGKMKQNYENIGVNKDSNEQISQDTSVSNNSQSIQIVLPKQANLFGEKQQNQNLVNNGTDSYGNQVNNQIVHFDENGKDLQTVINQKKYLGDQNNIQMQVFRQNTFGANTPAMMDAIKKGNYVTEDLNQQYQSAQFNNLTSQNGINPPFISFAQISQQSNLNSIENIISTNNQSEIKFDHLNGYGGIQYKLANKFNQNIGEQLKSNNKQTYDEDRSDKNNILIINNNDSQSEDYINNQLCNLQREAVIEYKTPNSKQTSDQLLTPASDDVINNFLDCAQKNNAYQIPNDFLLTHVQNNQAGINSTQNEQNLYELIQKGENLNSKQLEIQTPLNTNQYFNNGNFSGGGSSSIYKLTITPPQKDQLETPPIKMQQYEFENDNVAAFSDDHQFQYQNQQYYNNVMDGCQNISNIQKINEDETYNSKRSFDASADLLMMRSNQDIQEGIETSNFNNYHANMMANQNFLSSPKKSNRNQIQSNNQNQNQCNIQLSDRIHNSKNNLINQQNYTSNSNLSPNKNYLFTPSPTRKDDSTQFNQTFSEIQMIQFLKNKENVIETYEDGSYYEGEKMNGVRHGRGKFFYGDGGSFQGEWQNGHMNGYGVLYYPSQNKAYEGEWDDDKFNGKGIMYNERPAELAGTFNYHNMNEINDYWIKYEGDFKDDFKNGVGTLYLSNGERYIGRFKNDMVHGRGTFYKNDGSFITAEWSQNILLNYQ